jgi:putative spermidine/putrescine transport system ATP-binding protein
MGASLKAIGLEKVYGTATAVDGVDLDARPGEFVSLLGPSGCGKTTSLRLIAGLEQLDAGRIVIDGQDVTRFSPQSRGLGMVFQQYALFPNLSAYENIAFALRVRRQPRAEIERRVAELLAVVHLEEAADRYPHQLSGGMQQRVALARAIAAEPPLLLLDEPLSALDAAIRDELRTELRRLQRQLDLTVIYVTHDQAEAMALSDRIVVMERGQVSQIGSPRASCTTNQRPASPPASSGPATGALPPSSSSTAIPSSPGVALACRSRSMAAFRRDRACWQCGGQKPPRCSIPRRRRQTRSGGESSW